MTGRTGRAIAAGLLLAFAAAATAAPAQAPAPLAQQLLASGDTAGLPFAIVDKRAATIAVHAPDGRLVGRAPALIGQARGDTSDPRVGRLAQTGFVPAALRTTAAGRFLAEPGIGRGGDAIVWLDADAALAIHRVRPGREASARLHRLAGGRAEDRRASWGCVVVAPAFYEAAVAPWLGRGPSVVYVLDEAGVAPKLPAGRLPPAD